MDEDWDEELFEAAKELEVEINLGVPQETWRATISGSRVQLVSLGAHLAGTDGGVGTMFTEVEEAGVTIADLASSEDEDSGHELTVTFLAAGDPGAEAAITRWAGLVGYRRIWFPDRVVGVDNSPRFTDKATVTCSGCRHVWTGGGRGFWIGIMSRRAFPVFCLLCGGDLPQWELLPRPSYTTDCPLFASMERGSSGERRISVRHDPESRSAGRRAGRVGTGIR